MGWLCAARVNYAVAFARCEPRRLRETALESRSSRLSLESIGSFEVVGVQKVGDPVAERTLVIGDVHGCDVALDALLQLVAPTSDDRIVLLGDIVDRGPGSRQCVDVLLNLSGMCELVFIRGNHEEMMLDALAGGRMEAGWLQYGGRETLDSYGGYGLIPPQHIDFLASSIDYWEDQQNVYVHATLDPGLPLDQQPGSVLRWDRFTGEEPPLDNGKRVICGHTIQPHGLPALRDGWLCIDTYAYGGQFLSCLDTGNDLIYQSRQNGESRGPAELQQIAIPM